MESSFSITQDNDYQKLLETLIGDDDGISNIRISETNRPKGDGSAYGTFTNDPFGLQSGIVLSTGNVEDLAGSNLEDGGILPPQQTVLNFEKLGVFSSNTDVFVADLSKVGFDIQSIEISDSNSRQGGGSGVKSGFDLDAIKFSEVLLRADDLSKINDTSFSPSKDVFDFSPAGTILSLGTQRPGNQVGPDLNGTSNGFLDNTKARLESFDSDSSATEGAISLGDGGRVGFNLAESVTASQTPLYLYVGEGGESGENLEGLITVSNRRIGEDVDPSTDFLSDEEADLVAFTVEFEADTSVKDTLYFQYVFGSEEFIEYNGDEFNDSFEFRLNGTNLATLSDGRPASINQLTRDPDRSTDSSSDPYHPDFIYNPAIGSLEGAGPASDVLKLDGYTRPLLYEAPLKDGTNKLEIILQDVRDGELDSAAFFKGGTLGTTKPSAINGDIPDAENPDPRDPNDPNVPSEPGIPNGGAYLPELLNLTAFEGDVVVSLTLSRSAKLNNILQFYETDANGQVDSLKLSSPDYEEAVVDELLGPALYVDDKRTKTVEFTLPGGAYYAPALLINGNLDDLGTVQDAFMGDVRIQRNLKGWWFEDRTDNDFNDLIVNINSNIINSESFL